jgi:cation diffusion facilitator family transporter
MNAEIQARERREVSLSALGRERRARWVMGLTTAMMATELVAGYATKSLALTADGWHMATHAGVLGLAAGAYWFARTRAHDRSFTFGTGKVHALAGYTSAVILTLVALSMIVESSVRFVHPVDIDFREALPVSVLGLLVNILSIALLGAGAHDHEKEHHHDHGARGHDDHRHHHDHNHRAAYMHIVADAFTSVLAIGSLVLGRYLGWTMLDPVVGIIGGGFVLNWAVNLCRLAGRQLLDVAPSSAAEGLVRRTLEEIDDVRVRDLRVWDVGPGQRSCVVSIVTSSPRETTFYRERLLGEAPFAHLSVEVLRANAGERERVEVREKRA